MPTVRRPFVPEVYDNRSLVPIVELIGRQGAARAESQRRAGARSGQQIMDAGNAIAGTLREVRQDHEAAPFKAEQLAALESARADRLAKQQALARGTRVETAVGEGMAQPGFDPAAFLSSLPAEDRVLADTILSEQLTRKSDLAKRQEEIKALTAKHRAEVAGRIKGFRMEDGTYNPAAALVLDIEAQDDPELAQALETSVSDPAALAKLLDAYASFAPADEPFTLSPGSKRFDASGKEIASVPVTPPRRAFQSRNMLVNGKPMAVNFDTATGEFFLPGSDQPVQATPIPPQGPSGGEPLEAVIGPNGEPVLVRRSEAPGMRPATTREQATEDERKSAGFYRQMIDAMQTMDAVEKQLTQKDLYQMQSLPQEALVGMINRGEMSEAAKRYFRAFEQFTEARMRPVSGAAISDSEFARDRRTYAKQYGETPTLSKDRQRARMTALESLRMRSGRAMPKDAPAYAPPDEKPAYLPIDPNQVTPVTPRRPGGR